MDQLTGKLRLGPASWAQALPGMLPSCKVAMVVQPQEAVVTIFDLNILFVCLQLVYVSYLCFIKTIFQWRKRLRLMFFFVLYANFLHEGWLFTDFSLAILVQGVHLITNVFVVPSMRADDPAFACMHSSVCLGGCSSKLPRGSWRGHPAKLWRVTGGG